MEKYKFLYKYIFLEIWHDIEKGSIGTTVNDINKINPSIVIKTIVPQKEDVKNIKNLDLENSKKSITYNFGIKCFSGIDTPYFFYFDLNTKK